MKIKLLGGNDADNDTRRTGRSVRSPLKLRSILLSVIAIVLFVVGVRFAWDVVGRRVVAQPQYYLRSGQIEVSPQPDWIRSNVKEQVIQDANLKARLSILDEHLGEKLAEAFQLHPWVERVESVTKNYPANVRVVLRYRKPVVLVRTEGSSVLELVPFDAHGVRLPETDFSPTDKLLYPRLESVVSLPVLGQKSNDPAILGGAEIAALLHADWQRMRLARIVVHDSPGSGPPVFSLATQEGTIVQWGGYHSAEGDISAVSHRAASSLLGNQISGQQTSLVVSQDSLAKLEQLNSYYSQHGSLQGLKSLKEKQLPQAAKGGTRRR